VKYTTWKISRLTAVFTALAFLCTSALGPTPSAYSQSFSPETSSPVFDVNSIGVPPEWGKIEARFSPSEKSKHAPVIYIQDAHAVYGAQKSIQELLGYFQKNYSLSLVASEGAVGPLEPSLFRTFPVGSARRDVFDRLMKRGEVSGVDAAAVLNSEWSDFVGIEEKALYEKNRQAFIQALHAKESAIQKIEAELSKIQSRKSEVYSPELAELDQLVEAFESDSKGLPDLLTVLSKEAVSPNDFPHLDLVMRETIREKNLEDHQKAKEEVRLSRLIGWVKSRLRKNEQEKFRRLHRDFLSRKNTELFVEFLVAKAKQLGVPAKAYQQISTREKTKARLAALTGQEFFKELRILIQARKSKLFKSEEEQRLDREFQDLKLFRKLVSMEVTREELKTILHLPSAKNGPHRAYSVALTDAGGQALSFYQLAIERDQVLFENLKSVIAEKKSPLTAVVTGGFHAEGVTAFLREAGVPYVLISPRIEETGESPYLDLMLEQDHIKSSQIALMDYLGPKLIGEAQWRQKQAEWTREMLKIVMKQENVSIPVLFRAWHGALLKLALDTRQNSGDLRRELKNVWRDFVGEHPIREPIYRKALRNLSRELYDFFRSRLNLFNEKGFSRGGPYGFGSQGRKDSQISRPNFRTQSRWDHSLRVLPFAGDFQNQPHQPAIKHRTENKDRQTKSPWSEESSEDQSSKDNGSSIRRDPLQGPQLALSQFIHRKNRLPSTYRLVNKNFNEYYTSSRAEVRSVPREGYRSKEELKSEIQQPDLQKFEKNFKTYDEKKILYLLTMLHWILEEIQLTSERANQIYEIIGRAGILETFPNHKAIGKAYRLIMGSLRVLAIPSRLDGIRKLFGALAITNLKERDYASEFKQADSKHEKDLVLGALETEIKLESFEKAIVDQDLLAFLHRFIRKHKKEAGITGPAYDLGLLTGMASILGYSIQQDYLHFYEVALFSSDAMERKIASSFYSSFRQPGTSDKPPIIKQLKKLVEDEDENPEVREAAFQALQSNAMAVAPEFFEPYYQNRKQLSFIIYVPSLGKAGRILMKHLRVKPEDRSKVKNSEQFQFLRRALWDRSTQSLQVWASLISLYQQTTAELLSLQEAKKMARSMVREIHRAEVRSETPSKSYLEKVVERTRQIQDEKPDVKEWVRYAAPRVDIALMGKLIEDWIDKEAEKSKLGFSELNDYLERMGKEAEESVADFDHYMRFAVNRAFDKGRRKAVQARIREELEKGTSQLEEIQDPDALKSGEYLQTTLGDNYIYQGPVTVSKQTLYKMIPLEIPKEGLYSNRIPAHAIERSYRRIVSLPRAELRAVDFEATKEFARRMDLVKRGRPAGKSSAYEILFLQHAFVEKAGIKIAGTEPDEATFFDAGLSQGDIVFWESPEVPRLWRYLQTRNSEVEFEAVNTSLKVRSRKISVPEFVRFAQEGKIQRLKMLEKVQTLASEEIWFNPEEPRIVIFADKWSRGSAALIAESWAAQIPDANFILVDGGINPINAQGRLLPQKVVMFRNVGGEIVRVPVTFSSPQPVDYAFMTHRAPPSLFQILKKAGIPANTDQGTLELSSSKIAQLLTAQELGIPAKKVLLRFRTGQPEEEAAIQEKLQGIKDSGIQKVFIQPHRGAFGWNSAAYDLSLPDQFAEATKLIQVMIESHQNTWILVEKYIEAPDWKGAFENQTADIRAVVIRKESQFEVNLLKIALSKPGYRKLDLLQLETRKPLSQKVQGFAFETTARFPLEFFLRKHTDLTEVQVERFLEKVRERSLQWVEGLRQKDYQFDSMAVDFIVSRERDEEGLPQFYFNEAASVFSGDQHWDEMAAETQLVPKGSYREAHLQTVLALARDHQKFRDQRAEVRSSADPLKSKEEGEREQIEALKKLKVENFDRFFFTLGDFDLLSAINKLLSKALVGVMGKSGTPNLYFSKHSLYRETREKLNQIFRNQIHRYVGGDEIAPEISGAPDKAREKLERAVRRFSDSFKDRYGLLRISKQSLTRDEIKRLKENKRILVAARHGTGIHLLVDESRLSNAGKEAFRRRLGRLLNLEEDELKELRYENQNRGLFTLSTGAVSAKQTLDYLGQFTRGGKDYWIERGKIRPERAEEFYLWGMRMANDMLKHAKNRGRNQAFLPRRAIGPLVYKTPTREKIERETVRIEQHSSDGRDTLTGFYLPGAFRAVARNRSREFVRVAVMNYGFGEKRAFHELQEKVGYEGGNQIIRSLAKSVLPRFIGNGLSQNGMVLARTPPDTFDIASEGPIEIRGPPPEAFRRLNRATQAVREQAGVTELSPHFVVYKVSPRELRKAASFLRQKDIIGSPFQALDMLGLVEWVYEVMSAVSLRDLKNAANLTERQNYTVIEFNAAKVSNLVDLYRRAQDIEAAQALRTLRRRVGPRAEVRVEIKKPLEISDPGLQAMWNRVVEDHLRLQRFSEKLQALTHQHGLIFNFPKEEIEGLTTSVDFGKAPQAMSKEELYRLGYVTLNGDPESGDQENFRLNILFLASMMRAGLSPDDLSDNTANSRVFMELFRKQPRIISRLMMRDSSSDPAHVVLFNLFQFSIEELSMNVTDSKKELFLKEIEDLLTQAFHQDRVSLDEIVQSSYGKNFPSAVVLLPEFEKLFSEGFFRAPREFIENQIVVVPSMDLFGGKIGKVGEMTQWDFVIPVIPGESIRKVRKWNLLDGREVYAKRVDYLRVNSPEEEVQVAEAVEQALQARDPRFHAQKFIGVVYDRGLFYLLSLGVPGEAVLGKESEKSSVELGQVLDVLRSMKVAQPEDDVRLKDIIKSPDGHYTVMDFETLPHSRRAEVRAGEGEGGPEEAGVEKKKRPPAPGLRLISAVPAFEEWIESSRMLRGRVAIEASPKGDVYRLTDYPNVVLSPAQAASIGSARFSFRLKNSKSVVIPSEEGDLRLLLDQTYSDRILHVFVSGEGKIERAVIAATDTEPEIDFPYSLPEDQPNTYRVGPPDEIVVLELPPRLQFPWDAEEKEVLKLPEKQLAIIGKLVMKGQKSYFRPPKSLRNFGVSELPREWLGRTVQAYFKYENGRHRLDHLILPANRLQGEARVYNLVIEKIEEEMVRNYKLERTDEFLLPISRQYLQTAYAKFGSIPKSPSYELIALDGSPLTLNRGEVGALIKALPRAAMEVGAYPNDRQRQGIGLWFPEDKKMVIEAAYRKLPMFIHYEFGSVSHLEVLPRVGPPIRLERMNQEAGRPSQMLLPWEAIRENQTENEGIFKVQHRSLGKSRDSIMFSHKNSVLEIPPVLLRYVDRVEIDWGEQPTRHLLFTAFNREIGNRTRQIHYYLPTYYVGKYLTLLLENGQLKKVIARKEPEEGVYSWIAYDEWTKEAEGGETAPTGIRRRRIYFGDNFYPAFDMIRQFGWTPRATSEPEVRKAVNQALRGGAPVLYDPESVTLDAPESAAVSVTASDREIGNLLEILGDLDLEEVLGGERFQPLIQLLSHASVESALADRPEDEKKLESFVSVTAKILFDAVSKIEHESVEGLSSEKIRDALLYYIKKSTRAEVRAGERPRRIVPVSEITGKLSEEALHQLANQYLGRNDIPARLNPKKFQRFVSLIEQLHFGQPDTLSVRRAFRILEGVLESREIWHDENVMELYGILGVFQFRFLMDRDLRRLEVEVRGALQAHRRSGLDISPALIDRVEEELGRIMENDIQTPDIFQSYPDKEEAIQVMRNYDRRFNRLRSQIDRMEKFRAEGDSRAEVRSSIEEIKQDLQDIWKQIMFTRFGKRFGGSERYQVLRGHLAKAGSSLIVEENGTFLRENVARSVRRIESALKLLAGEELPEIRETSPELLKQLEQLNGRIRALAPASDYTDILVLTPPLMKLQESWARSTDLELQKMSKILAEVLVHASKRNISGMEEKLERVLEIYPQQELLQQLQDTVTLFRAEVRSKSDETIRDQETILYKWGTKEQGIKNVRDAIRRNRPGILEQYDHLASLTPFEHETLKNDIYAITQGHFNIWGLSGAINQKYTPYFQGSYINALISAFADLDLHPLGFRLDWTTEERAIDSIRFILLREAPTLIERHNRFEQLTLLEVSALKSDIYRISSSHVITWGIGQVGDRQTAPYFDGSYIKALAATFHKLHLNPLGFRLDWSTQEKAIESIHFVLSRETPDLLKKYDKWEQLSTEEKEDLKNEVYQISFGHFQVWGLTTALRRINAPYFEGNMVKTLQAVFPKLNLHPLGFHLDWTTREKAIESIRFVLLQQIPQVMERYNRISELMPGEIENLRDNIYRISQAYFLLWGLSNSYNQKRAPYFEGRYIQALASVFEDPRLGFSEEGIYEFRKRNRVINYQWNQGREIGIENIKEGIQIHRSDLLSRYERLNQLTPGQVEALKKEIYQIGGGHFKTWGLGAALNGRVAPYFNGSFKDVLIAVFPKLNLNPLGFELDWSSKEKALESIRFVLLRQMPGLLAQYDRFEQLAPDEVQALKNEIYRITLGHFNLWGLAAFRAVPDFNGSYIQALQDFFPKLHLESVGFQLDWSTEPKAIESIRFSLSKERPTILEKYERLDQLRPSEIQSLKKEIYKISNGHFRLWGLSGANNVKQTPYFGGSHIKALQSSFPGLELDPLGFQLDWSSEMKAVESIRFVFEQEAPTLIERYDRLDLLTPEEKEALKNEIYQISHAHFETWGLSAAFSPSVAPYFKGNYMDALIVVFPQLNLDPLGFRLGWSTEEKAIESIRFVLSHEAPLIIERYDRMDVLTPSEIETLRNEIYGIRADDFSRWGLSRVLSSEKVSYFEGSYINALLRTFNHPKLGLTREGFLKSPSQANRSEVREKETTFRAEVRADLQGWQNLRNWEQLTHALEKFSAATHSLDEVIEDLPPFMRKYFRYLGHIFDEWIASHQPLPSQEKQKRHVLQSDQFWPYVSIFPVKEILLNPSNSPLVYPAPEKAPQPPKDLQKHALRVKKLERALELLKQSQRAKELLGNVLLVGVDLPTHFMDFDPKANLGSFYYADGTRNVIYFSWALLDTLDLNNDSEMFFLDDVLKEGLRTLMIQKLLAKFDPSDMGEWIFMLSTELGEFNREVTRKSHFWMRNIDLINRLKAEDQDLRERKIRPRIDALKKEIPDLELKLNIQEAASQPLSDEMRDRLRFGYFNLISIVNELAFLEERMGWKERARKTYLQQIKSILGIQRVDWPGIAPADIQRRKAFVYLWSEENGKFLKALEIFLSEAFKTGALTSPTSELKEAEEYPRELEPDEKTILLDDAISGSSNFLKSQYLTVLKNRQAFSGPDQQQELDRVIQKVEILFREVDRRIAIRSRFFSQWKIRRTERGKPFEKEPQVKALVTSAIPSMNEVVFIDSEEKAVFGKRPALAARLEMPLETITLSLAAPKPIPENHLLRKILPEIRMRLKALSDEFKIVLRDEVGELPYRKERGEIDKDRSHSLNESLNVRIERKMIEFFETSQIRAPALNLEETDQIRELVKAEETLAFAKEMIQRLYSDALEKFKVPNEEILDQLSELEVLLSKQQIKETKEKLHRILQSIEEAVDADPKSDLIFFKGPAEEAIYLLNTLRAEARAGVTKENMDFVDAFFRLNRNDAEDQDSLFILQEAIGTLLKEKKNEINKLPEVHLRLLDPLKDLRVRSLIGKPGPAATLLGILSRSKVFYPALSSLMAYKDRESKNEFINPEFVDFLRRNLLALPYIRIEGGKLKAESAPISEERVASILSRIMQKNINQIAYALSALVNQAAAKGQTHVRLTPDIVGKQLGREYAPYNKHFKEALRKFNQDGNEKFWVARSSKRSSVFEIKPRAEVRITPEDWMVLAMAGAFTALYLGYQALRWIKKGIVIKPPTVIPEEDIEAAIEEFKKELDEEISKTLETVNDQVREKPTQPIRVDAYTNTVDEIYSGYLKELRRDFSLNDQEVAALEVHLEDKLVQLMRKLEAYPQALKGPRAKVRSEPKSLEPKARDMKEIKRIWYIDDEEILLFLAGRVFEKTKSLVAEGAVFITEHDPAAALERLKNSKKDFPDVIMLDYRLGTVSGIELAQKIRALRADVLIPIVIVTSNAAPELEEAERNKVITGWQTAKPTQADNFLKILNAAGFTDISRRAEVRSPSRKISIYERLGVRLFKKIAGNHLTQISFRGRKDLENLIEMTQHAETFHWMMFAALSIGGFGSWWVGAFPVTIIASIFNLLGNIYPIMLQRYNRARAIRVLSKKAKGEEIFKKLGILANGVNQEGLKDLFDAAQKLSWSVREEASKLLKKLLQLYAETVQQKVISVEELKPGDVLVYTPRTPSTPLESKIRLSLVIGKLAQAERPEVFILSDDGGIAILSDAYMNHMGYEKLTLQKSSRAEVRREISGGGISGGGEDDIAQQKTQPRSPEQGPKALKESTWLIQNSFLLIEGYNKILSIVNPKIAVAITALKRAFNFSKKLLAKAAAINRYTILANIPAMKILRSFPKKIFLGFISIGPDLQSRIGSPSSTQGRKIQASQRGRANDATQTIFHERGRNQSTSLANEMPNRMQVTPPRRFMNLPPRSNRLATNLNRLIPGKEPSRELNISQENNYKILISKTWEEIKGGAIGLLLASSREGVKEDVEAMIPSWMSVSPEEIDGLTDRIYHHLEGIQSGQLPLAEAGLQWQEKLMNEDPARVAQATATVFKPIYDLMTPLVSSKPERVILRIKSTGEKGKQKFLEELLKKMRPKDQLYVMSLQDPGHRALQTAAQKIVSGIQMRAEVRFRTSMLELEKEDIQRLYEGGKARGMAVVVVTPEGLQHSLNQVQHDSDDVPAILRPDIDELMAFLTAELPRVLEDLKAKEGLKGMAGLLLQLKERGVVVSTYEETFTVALDSKLVALLLAEIEGLAAAQVSA